MTSFTAAEKINVSVMTSLWERESMTENISMLRKIRYKLCQWDNVLFKVSIMKEQKGASHK